MPSCYAFQGVGSDGLSYCYNACATNPGWLQSPYSPEGNYYTPADNGQPLIPLTNWWTTQGGILLCQTQNELNAANAGRHIGGSCTGCLNTSPVTKSYDCVNGKCQENTSNSGYFKTLDDCQKICGFSCEAGKQCVDPNTFCPPGKVCLDSSEYSEAMAIISKLRGKFCR